MIPYNTDVVQVGSAGLYLPLTHLIIASLEQSKTAMVVTYHSNLPNLSALTKNNLPVLHASNRLKKAISECLPPTKVPSRPIDQCRAQASQTPTS